MSKDTSFHHDCGKGSRPRPYEVSQEEFTKKFDAIDWSVKVDSKKDEDVLKVENISYIGDRDIGVITCTTLNYGPNIVWAIDTNGNIIEEDK